MVMKTFTYTLKYNPLFSIPLRNEMIEYEKFDCEHNQIGRIVASAIGYRR